MGKYYKKVSLLGMVMLFWVANLFAQGPDTLWTKTYGGTASDVGYSVQQTPDSGYIIVGMVHLPGAGYPGIWLLKTDANGDTIWTKAYGGSHWDWGNAVQQTFDGGYIITGYTRSFGAGSPARSNVYLVKTNINGDTLWTKVYGGTGYENGYSAQQTSDSGYIVAAYTTSFGPGKENVWLLKTDSNGDTSWARTYGTDTTRTRGYSVRQTSDGGYIIAGEKTYVYPDVYLIKTDSVGDTLWTRTYGGTDYDYGESVHQTFDGGYIIAGGTYSFGVGTPDYGNVYLIKTDSLGDTLWTRVYGGDYDDYGYSVHQTFNGGYIVAGYKDNYDSVYLIKTDINGDTVWTKTYGGTGSDVGYSVQQTFDGGYIVAGETYSYDTYSYDVYLIKTGSDVGIEEKESSQRVFFTSQTRPNPFKNRTSITYGLLKRSNVHIVIYSLLGQRVRTLLNKEQDPGLYTVIWDGRDDSGRRVSSGSYFLKLEVSYPYPFRVAVEKFTATRKLCVVR